MLFKNTVVVPASVVKLIGIFSIKETALHKLDVFVNVAFIYIDWRLNDVGKDCKGICKVENPSLFRLSKKKLFVEFDPSTKSFKTTVRFWRPNVCNEVSITRLRLGFWPEKEPSDESKLADAFEKEIFALTIPKNLDGIEPVDL